MKVFWGGLVISLGILSSSANAEVTVNVQGVEYSLTALLENCKSMSDDPAGQIACFNAVSKLLEEQSVEAEASSTSSVPEAFEALRAAAEYEDGDSGLIIQGYECQAQFIYYANYFHISRRNVSSIDLFSVRFDASAIALNQTDQPSVGNELTTTGVMQSGAVAASTGGAAIDSAQFGFAPKSARVTVAEYAVEVADQLPADERNEFEFVLVHPAKQQFSAEIWNAFRSYVQECQR